jgi:hypothetical protein
MHALIAGGIIQREAVAMLCFGFSEFRSQIIILFALRVYMLKALGLATLIVTAGVTWASAEEVIINERPRSLFPSPAWVLKLRGAIA